MRNSTDIQEFKIPFQSVRDRALSSNLVMQKEKDQIIGIGLN